MAVREEMWAQAARDRDALEAELGARHEGERERLLEEAQERANAMVEEVQCMSGYISDSPQPDHQVRCRATAIPLRPASWFCLLFFFAAMPRILLSMCTRNALVPLVLHATISASWCRRYV